MIARLTRWFDEKTHWLSGLIVFEFVLSPR